MTSTYPICWIYNKKGFPFRPYIVDHTSIGLFGLFPFSAIHSSSSPPKVLTFRQALVKMIRWRPWPPLIPPKKFEATITVRHLAGLTAEDSDRFSVGIKWKGSKGINVLGSLRRTLRRNFTREEVLKADGIVQWDEEFRCHCSFYTNKDGLFHPWQVSLTVFTETKQGTTDDNGRIVAGAAASLNLAEFASAADKHDKEVDVPLSVLNGRVHGSAPTLHLSIVLLQLSNAEEPFAAVARPPILSFPGSHCYGDALSTEKEKVPTWKTGAKGVNNILKGLYLLRAKKASHEKMGTTEAPLRESEPAPAEVVPKLVKTTNPASEEDTLASHLVVPPFSVVASEKPVESTSFPVFSSKVADKFPALSSESNKNTESGLESSSSLFNASASTRSQLKLPGLDKSGHPSSSEAGDINNKSDEVPYTKRTHASSSSPVFATAAADHLNQASTGSGLMFISTTSFSNIVSTGISANTSATSSGSIFGLSAKPSNSAGPFFKLGASVDPTTSVPATSASIISELADEKTKVDTNPSSHSSSIPNSSVAASAAVNPENSSFGLSSSVSHSTVNLQGSLFGSASKSIVSGTGTVSQDASLPSVPSTSSPGTVSQGTSVLPVSSGPSTLFGMSGNTSGSSFSNPQVLNSSNAFSYSLSASSSDTTTAAPGSGSTSSVFKFGASPVSEANAVSSSSASTPGTFSFGFGSSTSSSTTATGSNSSATLPKFNFGSNSSVPVGSSSTGSLGIFNFGGNSSTSSAVNTVGSNTAANVFGSSWSSPASSIFGSSSTTAPASSIFGSSSTTPASSIFGSNTAANVFGSSWSSPASSLFGSSSTTAPASSIFYSSSTTPASSIFGSSSTTPASSIFGSSSTTSHASSIFGSSSTTSPSTAFSFGGASTSSAATNTAPVSFNSSTGASSSPMFSFTTASASVWSSPSLPTNQPVFGNPPSNAFGSSSGNNEQMNAEDSMAENPVQSSTPSTPLFGQSSVTPSPPGFTFGSTVPSQPNPFMFGSQQNQVAPQNPSPFQASGSLEFNAGGSFSLGSGGGGDKSGRRAVRVSRSNKNRKPGSLEFNASGSFFLGSGGGGGDKSGRRAVRVSRSNKNRKPGSLEFNAGGSFSLGSGGGGEKSGQRAVRVSRSNKSRKR